MSTPQTSVYYVRCEDFAVAFIGPFPTIAAAVVKIQHIAAKWDSSTRIVTSEESSNERTFWNNTIAPEDTIVN